MHNKYKVVDKHTIRPEYDDLPMHFLGNTMKEAEEVYDQYSDLLNKIAYTYFISTGLEKSDLFAEALIGLARAKQDFDDTRSDDFIIYAIFRIKDALNEYIRKYAHTVVVPSYLRKASRNFELLRNLLETGSINIDVVLDVLEYGEIIDGIPDEIYDTCENLLGNLNRCAERAGVSYNELVDRLQLLPEESELREWDACVEEDDAVTNIYVKQLFEFMTDEERIIAKGIMDDKSYEEIGKGLGKTKQWVSLKFKDMQRRLNDKLSWS